MHNSADEDPETSHHCSHAHADREESYMLTPSEDIDSPTQVDRLIAFLHSHFGQVEFLSPEEANAEADKLHEEEEEKKPKVEDESIVDEAKVGEADAPKNGHVSGPVIRVRLDQYVADVGVEDLVSGLFSLGKQQLTPSHTVCPLRS